MTWYVYILECRNAALYTGVTTNIPRRFYQHRAGHGARFTRAFGARRLLFWEALPSREEALRREREIKSWSRPDKIRWLKKQGVI